MRRKFIVLSIFAILLFVIAIVGLLFMQTTQQNQMDFEAHLTQEELSMDKMVIKPTAEDDALAQIQTNGSTQWNDELVLTRNDEQIIALQQSTVADIVPTTRNASRMLDSTEDEYIAVIGDSFSAPGPVFYWTEILANATGYKVIDKARNSTGFTVGDVTFKEQLEQVVADENFHKVKHIIVYGGVNDFQSGASINDTIAAVEEFWAAYTELDYKPELYIAFGNIGYAQCERFNGFYEWYTAISQVLENDGVTSMVQNVPYWHFNESSCFFDDLIHPNPKGQNIIATYMGQVLNGSYTGVQRTQWYEGLIYNGKWYSARKTIHFDNGVITVTVKMEGNMRLKDLESNSFIDLGEVTNYSKQYSLMFGTDNTNNPVIWVFDAPVYEAYKDEKFGILRPMFNVANKHLYFQMFGYAGAYKDRIADMNQLQMTFMIYPTNW